jgi:hypothetical protein
MDTHPYGLRMNGFRGATKAALGASNGLELVWT